MSKRVRKNNYTSYNPYHMYSFGGGFKEGLGNLSFNGTGLGQAVGQNIGAISSAIGGMAGGLLSNGLESKTGSILNTVGDIGSMVPGPWGAVIGGGAKILGGAVNAMFGSKVNQEKLNAANQGTSYLNNFTSNASSFDEIQGPQAQTAVENAYKGGLFSKGKARRRNAELRRQRQEAQLFANRSVENNVENIADEQMNNMLANYAAFGGPLDFGLMPIGGAIDYELAQRRLAQRDLEIQGKGKFAVGGPLHTHGADWTNGITIIDNGGSHESNPFEGVPMGIASDGQPNLVEEGEVIFNDYVFSNRLKVPKAVREKYKLRGQKDMTFADAAKKAQKESEERPNDPISKRGLVDIMYKLMREQEQVRQKRVATSKREFAKGGKILAHKHATDPYLDTWKGSPYPLPSNYWEGRGSAQDFIFPGLGNQEYNKTWGPVTVTPKKSLFPVAPVGDEGKVTTGYVPLWSALGAPRTPRTRVPQTGSKTTTRESDTHNSGLAGLRFVPAIGAGIGVFSDLMGWTNKPDYSNADSILSAAGSIGDVHYTPIGDYMRYTPLDRLFYANQLGSQAGATRRNIMNTSGGNRGAAMAGLLAADYNAQEQLGNLFRQAEEYNLGQRERVAAFNRATNMFNVENELKAQIANRENAKIRVDAAAKAAAIRDQVDARIGAARSANLTNLFNSLGDIGREAFTMNMVMSNPALYYSIGKDGTITYKNGFDELSEGEKAQVRRAAERASKEKAYGGYLTIRRRR